ERDPVQDQVQQRFVEGRQPEPGHRRQARAGREDEPEGALHATLPGRASSTSISSEKDTSGAHEGAVTAMVTASVTPMMQPAMSGPSGRPRPASMTAANTTPIQA